jgi:predicted permease
MRFDIRPRIRRAFRLALRRRDLSEREIEEELRTHLDLRVSQLVDRGLSPADAERQALSRLGGSWQEAVSRLSAAGRVRDDRLQARERIDAAWGDLRYAIRALSRQRAFALVVIVTFALGIGANATMFGVIDRLLLRPPPHVRAPGELLEVGRVATQPGIAAMLSGMQYPLYTRLRADTAAFREVAASSFIAGLTLGSGAGAEQVLGVFVNSDYFRVLGTSPALGRFFGLQEDGDVPSSDVVVLSHGFWQRRFAGDPSILGKTLHVGPRSLTVIGVAPESFSGVDPRRVDMWIPINQAAVYHIALDRFPTHWGSVWVRILVRLKPGVSASEAAARATTIYNVGFSEWASGANRKGMGLAGDRLALRSILPAEQLADNPEAKLARLLFAVAAVVLAIACANVASLALARGTERRRELAVRLALGVSRWRLFRMLVTETVALAVCGGVIAIVVAQWGITALQRTLLSDFAWTESALDPRVLAVTLGLVLLTIVLAGLAPALRASRPDVVEALKTGGREGGVALSRVRSALMIAQAALSVVLVVGAGLFVHSLEETASVQLGYEPSRVLSATMDVESYGYSVPARGALYAEMRARALGVPGVADAAISSTHPLLGWRFGMRMSVPGRDTLPRSPVGGPYYNAVGAGYFSTLGLRLVEGRPLTSADVSAEARVAVLSEAMARAYWPGERAVDRCILLRGDSVCTTVVGVAADAKERLQATDPPFLVYVPLGPRWNAGANTLLVRSRDADAARLVEPVRRAMQGIASNLPYADVQSLGDLLAPEIRPWRTAATLFSLFGALALLISAGGLYSAISYSVTQRRHEFGVRMALGAQVGDVVRQVMDQGLRAALIGLALGSAIAFAAGRFVETLLFQTSPRSPSAFATAAMLIVIVAVAATFIPAWRASRVDPVTALRGD